MNVRELKEALVALPAEYDESTVVVNATGIFGPGEATRLITIPELKGVDHQPSYAVFKNAVWLDDGGPSVSKQGEAEGYRVPYYKPIRETP